MKVNEIYEVGNITNTKVIICNVDTKFAIAAIDIDSFNTYFSKYNGWTEWKPLYKNDVLEGYFRTNYKRVQVVNSEHKFKSQSSCNKMDVFSIDKGIKLAAVRCRRKELSSKIKLLDKQIKEYNDQFFSLSKESQSLRKIIRSFEKRRRKCY